MRKHIIVTEEKQSEYFLYPGAIFVHVEPYWVTTILGSCVSVCLWDQKLKIGGINHYLLPFWNGVGLASPKYGNIAIEKLIERMIRLGSRPNNLKAKIFGGAAILERSRNSGHVGLKNIALARKFLKSAGIPIVDSDVGGNLGRKLRFNTVTGVALVKILVEGRSLKHE